VKCFGVCPRAGRFSATGYRGITLIAEIDEKPLEVQLMTPYMVMWADWAYGVLLDVSMSLKFQFRYEVPSRNFHFERFFSFLRKFWILEEKNGNPK
jgi:hypothetical protein